MIAVIGGAGDWCRSFREEGTWGGASIGSRTRQQIWDLDLIGNWSQDQLDLNGDNDFVDAGEFSVSSTFNAANEQTARSGATLVWDAVGNLTNDDEQYEYIFDVFGRLVQVLNQSSLVISQHRYNGLGFRIAWQYDLDGDGGVEPTNSNDDPWLYFVYDSSWRIVASVFAVDDGGGTEAGVYLAMADDEPHATPGTSPAGLALGPRNRPKCDAYAGGAGLTRFAFLRTHSQ